MSQTFHVRWQNKALINQNSFRPCYHYKAAFSKTNWAKKRPESSLQNSENPEIPSFEMYLFGVSVIFLFLVFLSPVFRISGFFPEILAKALGLRRNSRFFISEFQDFWLQIFIENDLSLTYAALKLKNVWTWILPMWIYLLTKYVQNSSIWSNQTQIMTPPVRDWEITSSSDMNGRHPQL